MCIIIDASMMGSFLSPRNENMQVIHKLLLKKQCKLAYSDYKKIADETVRRSPRWKEMLLRYERSGCTKKIASKEVKKAIENLPEIASDDEHILGLAKAGKISVLCTKDKKLIKDFKNKNIINNGNIYEDASDKHLLKDTCP